MGGDNPLLVSPLQDHQAGLQTCCGFAETGTNRLRLSGFFEMRNNVCYGTGALLILSVLKCNPLSMTDSSPPLIREL